MQERFHEDWSHDRKWGWQQDSAVVGHNLKIAWNLTRCAYYFQTRAERLRREGKDEEADSYTQRSDKCLEVAQRLEQDGGHQGEQAGEGQGRRTEHDAGVDQGRVGDHQHDGKHFHRGHHVPPGGAPG